MKRIDRLFYRIGQALTIVFYIGLVVAGLWTWVQIIKLF